MDGTRKYHPGWDILGQQQHARDVHSDRWILSPKYKLLMIEPTDSKLNKNECLSEDILIPLRRNKIAVGG